MFFMSFSTHVSAQNFQSEYFDCANTVDFKKSVWVLICPTNLVFINIAAGHKVKVYKARTYAGIFASRRLNIRRQPKGHVNQ